MRDKILSEILSACDDLIYISEQDAPITAFLSDRTGEEARGVTPRHLSAKADENIEEVDLDSFFERLTSEKDWYGEEEKERARRFRVLKKTLEDNLTRLQVLKLGRITKDIFVVGRDKDDRLMGVMTESVET